MKMFRTFLFAALLCAAAPAIAEEPAAAKDSLAKPEAVAPEAANSIAVPATAPAAAAAKKWDVVPAKSSITFHGKQMGTEFEGVISKFTADIAFDAANLDGSKVTADIDINSIDAKDAERNKSIKGSDWFDTEHFPSARFESTKFTKTGDNSFTADANLTIHGISVPVQLPFTLTEEKVGFGQDRMVMTGTVTLDRSKFKLGQGDWADPSVIANEVPVSVQVTATPAAATP
jgi:polyisoprenoid-binding protein YceI